MSIGGIERPDLPEYMTWEELERLPEEIAEQIELWNGRVVSVRRGPAEHQNLYPTPEEFHRGLRAEGHVRSPGALLAR